MEGTFVDKVDLMKFYQTWTKIAGGIFGAEVTVTSVIAPDGTILLPSDSENKQVTA